MTVGTQQVQSILAALQALVAQVQGLLPAPVAGAPAGTIVYGPGTVIAVSVPSELGMPIAGAQTVKLLCDDASQATFNFAAVTSPCVPPTFKVGDRYTLNVLSRITTMWDTLESFVSGV